MFRGDQIKPVTRVRADNLEYAFIEALKKAGFRLVTINKQKWMIK